MQMATEKSEEITKNTKRKELEIQLWLSRNKLHDKMKEQIISCIQYRLKEKKDFDTENPIPHLSDIKLTKEIKRYICLPLLKNVSSFSSFKLLDKVKITVQLKTIIIFLLKNVKKKKKNKLELCKNRIKKMDRQYDFILNELN
jgi:hypothetical protein